MAAKRSIPTNLFASPDFFELSSDTIRLILIGIILDADDEGRGSAHPRLLARKLDTTPEAVDQALRECEAHGMLRCYLVEGRSYYVLLHWHKYQVLSRPTPSSYPPPPQDQPSPTVPPTGTSQGNPGSPGVCVDSPGDAMLEEEGEEKEKESELEEKRTEDEEEDLPPSITRFPPTTSDSGDGALLSSNPLALEETKRVASLLKLPVSEQLGTIVQEFCHIPTISLVGEAIEARTWIDDPHRNRRGQPMTPAFFRRWLKRERGDYGSSASNGFPTRSSRGKAHTSTGTLAHDAPSDQPDTDDPYWAYFLQRMAEVKEKGYRPEEVAS